MGERSNTRIFAFMFVYIYVDFFIYPGSLCVCVCAMWVNSYVPKHNFLYG